MADVSVKTTNLFSDQLVGMTWWDGLITADERFTLYIAEVKPNTTYTASGDNSVDNIMVAYFSVYPAEGQASVDSERYVYPTDPTRSVATFTVPDDSRIKYAAVRFGSDATNVMLNLGSTVLPDGWRHSLYKFNASWQDASIKEWAGGQNLFDFEGWYAGTRGANNGTISWDRNNQAFTLSASADNCFTFPYATDYDYRYAYKLPVEANTTYELSWSADNDNQGNIFVIKNGNPLDSANGNNANEKAFVFTTNSDTTEITFRFGVENAGESITYSNIKLQKKGWI